MTSSRQVTSTDGVRLAVQEHGDPANPTLVAVHGYPDNHAVWDGVVELLRERFHVVTYDVRGAGDSDKPRGHAAYRIEQLVADFGAVIDAVSPDRPVHLLAHDWGSIQLWDALTEKRFGARVASFTSVSGPSLDYAGVWMRGVRRHPRAALVQLLDSYYVAMFQLPRIPELLARAGVVDRGVALSSSRGRSTKVRATGAHRLDAEHGIGLYRANMLPRLLRPRPPVVKVPVQVIAPTHDMHVSHALAVGAPTAYVQDLRTHTVDGNHWIVAQEPALIAGLVQEFVAEHAERKPSESTP